MIRNLLIPTTLLMFLVATVHCGPPPMPKGPPPEYEEPPAPSWLADAATAVPVPAGDGGGPDSASPQ